MVADAVVLALRTRFYGAGNEKTRLLRAGFSVRYRFGLTSDCDW